MFGFCACINIKQVSGYKETDLVVQVTDNYLDIPSIPSIYLSIYVKSICLCTHIYTFLHLVSYLERNIELQNIMQSFDLPFVEEIEIPADNGRSDDTMTLS